MFEIRDRPKVVEKALLIGAYFEPREKEEAASLLEELAELVTTLGIPIAESVLVYVRDSNRKYLTGSGKAAELIAHAKELGCDVIIFDNGLAPMQQRAWETSNPSKPPRRRPPSRISLSMGSMPARSGSSSSTGPPWACSRSLKADDKKMLVVLNKIDLIPAAHWQEVAPHFPPLPLKPVSGNPREDHPMPG